MDICFIRYQQYIGWPRSEEVSNCLLKFFGKQRTWIGGGTGHEVENAVIGNRESIYRCTWSTFYHSIKNYDYKRSLTLPKESGGLGRREGREREWGKKGEGGSRRTTCLFGPFLVWLQFVLGDSFSTEEILPGRTLGHNLISEQLVSHFSSTTPFLVSCRSASGECFKGALLQTAFLFLESLCCSLYLPATLAEEGTLLMLASLRVFFE